MKPIQTFESFKAESSLNEQLGVAEYDEYVNPAYIELTLTDGRKLKIDRKYVKGGKQAYEAILYFLENMDRNPKAMIAILTIVQQMVDKLENI